MPQSGQPRVFISYAHKDGAELAQRLHEDLGKNFDTWLDRHRLTAGDIWTREIEDAIDRATVILALLSSGSYISDICRAEQQRALEKGKCVIPVRVKADCDVPLYLQTRQWLDFSNAELYPELLPRLIDSIEKQSGVAFSPQLLVRYNNAPALSENFVNRPALLESLRNTLFTEGANRNIAVTAMQGMGGIGKTVLAQALCRDEVVQQAFPDGIFWFAISKELQFDFSVRMKSVPGLDRLLGSYDGEAACVAQYRDVLRKKAALIVVDGVWYASDVQPFIVDSPRSRLLITTRDTSIAAWFGARQFSTSLLTEAESRQVLANWCGRPVDDLPPQASDVIHECGYLPLALAMIGAQLKGKPVVLWNAVLDHLRKADLQKIKAQFPEPHTTLFRAIQVSVDALDETARQRYLALAVLPEGMEAAPQLQQCIWGMNDSEAAEAAQKFLDLSLATYNESQDSIRLHDLQLDYVRALWQGDDKEALRLIHGAIRLSSHVITSDPAQFPSQIVGRLLPYQSEIKSDHSLTWELIRFRLTHRRRPRRGLKAIERFGAKVEEGAHATWLRPMHPALHPPGTRLIRTLTGHTSNIEVVVVTTDGRLGISASEDKTLKVWDLERGHILHTLSSHSRPVNDVAVTPDRRWAVSASADKTLKVWDLESGRELRTLCGHTNFVNAVAVTPDGLRAVSASDDNTLKVWDLSSGHELRTLTGHANWVNAVVVTADGQRAVSASWDRTLQVWDLVSGRKLRTLSGHSGVIRALAVTPDGQRAVSASSDQTVKVWDLSSGRELYTLKGHTNWVTAIVVTPDGQRAVSGSWDRTLKVWDLSSGRELRTLFGHLHWVTALAVSEDGKRVTSASIDDTLKVWDLSSGRVLYTLFGHTQGVTAVVVTPDGQKAVSAAYDKALKIWDLSSAFDQTLRVWDFASERDLRNLFQHIDKVRAVALTPDGRLAVTASSDRTLKVWELSTGLVLVRTLIGHTERVDNIEPSEDGQLVVTSFYQNRAVFGIALSGDGRLAVSSSDQTLKVWDISAGRELHTLYHTDADHTVIGVALSLDGRIAVSASDDRTLKIWDVSTGRELRTLTGHTGGVNGVALSANGQIAVSASLDNTLKVWEVASGRELRTLTGHTGGVNGVALSGNAQTAVSASSDNTLKVWEVASGRELSNLSGHSGSVAAVAVTSDGQRVVSASKDSTLKVWELETGHCIATFTCDSAALCCAYSAALKLIVAGDAGGHVHFLRLEERKAKA